MLKVIKEIIVMLLVCFVTILGLAVVLYKFVPNRKIVPTVTEYSMPEEIENLMEDDVDMINNQSDVILTYEVTEGELKDYQNTNNYVPGKTNPFMPHSSETDGEVANPETSTDTIKESSSVDKSNSNSNSNSNSVSEIEYPSVFNEGGKK